jgi:glycine cleavage system H lipoate-binding protein
MSILFVLLMFLLIMSVSYFLQPRGTAGQQPAVAPPLRAPRLKQEFGFEVPEGYWFHPGHMWANRESPDLARVGIDKFATNLVGKIDRVEICGTNRWVRQGQKLVTLTTNGTTLELLSPVEGVVMALNNDALGNPKLVTDDPYNSGWIALVKAPDLSTNRRNLVQEGMVVPWMQNSVSRLNTVLSELQPSLAQDGGMPVSGLLPSLAPELQQKVAKEFFLS